MSVEEEQGKEGSCCETHCLQYPPQFEVSGRLNRYAEIINAKIILNYQDHLTKFIVLRPLVSKRAEEVAYHIRDIFLSSGSTTRAPIE